MFHGLFMDEEESKRGLWDPQQGITVRHFRESIQHFLRAGYRFVSPPEILAGLDPRGRYALITFDDGYFNNTRALPILAEFDASALFFVSTEHVTLGKAFWWDALYRAGRAAGRTREQIYGALPALKRLRAEELERSVCQIAGTDVLSPVGDVDRPFSPDELRRFADDERVFVGNHTCNHAVLTGYDAAGVRREIAQAQTALERLTGRRPTAIAYPDGGFDQGIAEAARAAGLELGFTTEPRKEYLCNLEERRMVLGRFCPWGDREIACQCSGFRSDIALEQRYRSLKRSVRSLVNAS